MLRLLVAVLLVASLSSPAAAGTPCGDTCGTDASSDSSSLMQSKVFKDRNGVLLSKDTSQPGWALLRPATEQHFQALSEMALGTKAVPTAIATYLVMIRNHSMEIKSKLSIEHNAQSGDLDTTFSNIAACDTSLSTRLTTVEGSGPTTAQSLAAAAKASLCACRKLQAAATADAQGCQDQLACYATIQGEKLAEEDAFLVDGTGQPVEMYSAGSVDLCATSNGWQSSPGATNVDKALAWFASEKTAWETHWDNKKSAFEGLINAHTSATNTHDSFKAGTGQYAGQGCDALNELSTNRSSTCSTLQVRATMNQCHYLSEKKDSCDTYTQCRVDEEAAWTTATQRETTNSADRKDAWVAASTIECLANMFSEDAQGNMQINASAASNCGSITCDAACNTALDISTSLARTFTARVACALPAIPCATSGSWSPFCSAAETSSYGSHTPAYLVGARTAPACDGTPVAVDLASGQVTETCQACSQLSGWNTSDFTPFTSATNAPTAQVPPGNVPPKPPPTQTVTDFETLRQCMKVNNSVCSLGGDLQVLASSDGNHPTGDSPGLFVGVDLHVTVLGNGYTLDGGQQYQIMQVFQGTLTVHDIIYKNAKGPLYGGAVYVRSSDKNRIAMFSCYHCNFLDNRVKQQGAAVYAYPYARLAFGSALFQNGYAEQYAGAIFINGPFECRDCKFISNTDGRSDIHTAIWVSRRHVDRGGWKASWGLEGSGYVDKYGINPAANSCHPFICENCHFSGPDKYIADYSDGGPPAGFLSDESSALGFNPPFTCPAGSSAMGTKCVGIRNPSCANAVNCDDFALPPVAPSAPTVTTAAPTGMAAFTGPGNPDEADSNGYYGGCLHGIGGSGAAGMTVEECAARCVADDFTGGNANLAQYNNAMRCDAFEVYIPDYASGGRRGHCHLQNFENNREFCPTWGGGASNYYYKRTAAAATTPAATLGESILLSTAVALPEGESTHHYSTGQSLLVQGVDFVRQCGNSNNDPYMVQYNSQGDTVDLAAFITGGGVGGTLGVDTHGRGNVMGFEGESGGSGKGFGCHANWLITFDLQTIRTKYFAGRPGNYRFTGRFGMSSNAGDTSQRGQGVVLCDGVVSAASDKLKRSDGGQDVTAQVPSSARYLTIAMLNGDESTSHDDQVWLDPTLHEVVG